MPSKKTKSKHEPLKPCPRKDAIRVMQFQFFDNCKSGKGVVQHTIVLEAYCENRLNLFAPYWKRTVQLTEPKLAIRWADRKLADGEMTAEQHFFYQQTYDHCVELAAHEDTEWVKIGHIGSKRENKRYVGQRIYGRRGKGGPMECVVFLDGEMLGTERFQHDKFRKAGGRRRKAYGFYDPQGMYDAMKREKAQRAAADAKEAERAPEGDAESILIQNEWTLCIKH